MRRLVLLAHTSLDGIIAGIKGELDGFEAGDENLEFVCQLTEQADAAMFGRVSYQLLNSHWPTAKDLPGASGNEIRYSNWYNEAKKIIISRTLPGSTNNDSIIIRHNITDEIRKLKDLPGRDILIFGSASISQLLMKAGLIDSYWIFINPVIFGKGIPLFTDLPDPIKLRHSATHLFPNGEIALNYLLQ